MRRGIFVNADLRETELRIVQHYAGNMAAQSAAAALAIEKLKDQYRAEGATIIGDEVIVPSNKESNG